MSAQEDDKLDRILQTVEKISRGVYGDPDNGVDGLIKENKDQEKRISALEDHQKKQKWMIAGVSFSVPVIIHFVKDRLHW
jgi:hypothetical protein